MARQSEQALATEGAIMVGHPGQAYGQDLRDRVLNAKGSIREVALRFGVSESYVDRARSRRRHQTDRNERKPDEQAGATSFQQLSELAMHEICLVGEVVMKGFRHQHGGIALDRKTRDMDRDMTPAIWRQAQYPVFYIRFGRAVQVLVEKWRRIQ